MPITRTLTTTGIPWRPAGNTAAIAMGVSVVVCLVGAFVTFGADAGPVEILRRGVHAWLVAVGATYTTGDVTVTLVPWGAVLIVAGIAALAARRMVPNSMPDLGAFAAMAGGIAGVVAGIASAATNTGAVHTSVTRATFGAFLVVGLGALVGAASRFDSLSVFSEEQTDLRTVVTAAASGLGALVAGAVLVLLTVMMWRVDRAGEMWTSLDPGLGGGMVLAVLCIAALPTMVLWIISVMMGPGFWIGTESHVTLGGADLGLIPGFPALAALPEPGDFSWWVYLVAAVPVLAGALAGAQVVNRDEHAEPTMGRHAVFGAAAGALAGLAAGLLTMSAQGSMGPGLLQTAGPQSWWILVISPVVLAVGGALGAAVAHYRVHRVQPS